MDGIVLQAHPVHGELHTVAYAENFHGEGFGSGSYGGHLYLVFAVCNVTILRHFHVSKPTFWRSFLT